MCETTHESMVRVSEFKFNLQPQHAKVCHAAFQTTNSFIACEDLVACANTGSVLFAGNQMLISRYRCDMICKKTICRPS